MDFLVHPVQDYRNDQIKTEQQNQCNKKSHVIQLIEQDEKYNAHFR